jgi:hypothetical protein
MTIIPNTEVRLLSSVPLNNSYEHTLYWKTAQDQNNYFLSKSRYYFNDFTYQRDTQSVRVPMPYDSVYDCNYLMYRNNSFGSKWFYAFITKKEYINPNLTQIYFEIDTYQTWIFSVQWNPTFVEREHRNRWNQDGTPVINTVEENLNYGTEYRIASAEQYRPCDGVYFLVVACKQGMHGSINKGYYATNNGIPQFLVYYLHPFTLAGDTPNTNLGSLSLVTDLLAAVYAQDNAVNNVVSVYVTDCLPNNPSYVNGTVNFDSNNYELVQLTGQVNGASVSTIFVNEMNYGDWIYAAGNKHAGFTPQSESKLTMSPYRIIELVDLRGNRVTYKPEYIDSPDLTITISASLGVNNKVAYQIKDYLTGALNDDGVKIKINMETALISNEPNELPILTDLLAAYLQGNRNTIQNNRNALVFNGTMGALQAGIGAATHSMMAAPMLAEGAQSVGNAYYELQGINAKIQDIRNQPPAISNLGNNVYFDYGHGLTGVWILKKEITPEYQKKLTDYFKMFGYKVNELELPNLQSRQHWNFIKTIGCNIYGDIPNEDLEKIRSIYNNGVTLWHGDWVGNYNLANSEV